jgi:uncharacterized protein with HEPN domain
MPLDERDESRLRDMQTYSREAVALLGSMTLPELEAHTMARLAVTRCVEIIGEAGHKVSAPVQATLPAIPWHRMYSMRNRLIHDYGNTNYDIVFRVVREELPGLVTILDSYLAQHGHTA